MYELPFAGVNVALEQYADGSERDARLLSLRQNGFGWARQRFDWSQIETQPNVYRWHESDAIMRSLGSYGLEPVVVLDGSPAWARRAAVNAGSDNALAPPDHLEDFARFAGKFAERYAAQVRYYQIWDEPNVAPHWGNRWVNPVEYSQMLRLASTAIRGADADAVILLGALAPTADRGHLAVDEVYFLQRMYASGAQGYFDAVAIQPFGFGHTPEDPAQHPHVLNFQRALLVRWAMVAAGDAETPIIAARWGWNRQPGSPWRTVSEHEQSEFASRSLGLAYGRWPWLAGMAWAIDRPAVDRSDPLWGFSLNESLDESIAQWDAQRVPRATMDFPNAQRAWPRWALLAFASSVVLWRMIAALRIAPWRAWQQEYARLGSPARMAIWAVLLVAYYYAVWPPLIVLCWIAAAILILANPSSGLMLAAATLPFYFQHKELHWGDLSLTIAPAVAASLCLLPALVTAARRGRRALDRWDALAGGWLAVMAFSAIGVWHWPAYWRGMLELTVVPLILFWAVRAYATSGKDQRALMTAMVIGGLLVAVHGLADWLLGGGNASDSMRRLVGPYFSPNHTALYLGRVLFVAVGLALYHSMGARSLYGMATAVLGVALVLTASRGALLLGLPAGLVLLGLYAAANRRRQTGLREGLSAARGAIPLRSLVLLSAVPIATSAITWERLSNSATIHERLALWRSAAGLARDFALTGTGPAGFYWRFPAYIPAGSSLDPNLQHPHNLWLEYLTTGGIAAFLWLVVAAGLVIHGVWAARGRKDIALKWPSYGLLAALVAALAHAHVDAFGALPDIAAWNWMALGILAVVFTAGQDAKSYRSPNEKPPQSRDRSGLWSA